MKLCELRSIGVWCFLNDQACTPRLSQKLPAERHAHHRVSSHTVDKSRCWKHNSWHRFRTSISPFDWHVTTSFSNRKHEVVGIRDAFDTRKGTTLEELAERSEEMFWRRGNVGILRGVRVVVCGSGKESISTLMGGRRTGGSQWYKITSTSSEAVTYQIDKKVL